MTRPDVPDRDYEAMRKRAEAAEARAAEADRRLLDVHDALHAECTEADLPAEIRALRRAKEAAEAKLAYWISDGQVKPGEADLQAKLAAAEAKLAEVERLGARQWGCAGTHRGTGAPGCPKEPHHHHDERCVPGLQARLAEVEREADRLASELETAEHDLAAAEAREKTLLEQADAANRVVAQDWHEIKALRAALEHLEPLAVKLAVAAGEVFVTREVSPSMMALPALTAAVSRAAGGVRAALSSGQGPAKASREKEFGDALEWIEQNEPNGIAVVARALASGQGGKGEA